MPCGDILHIMVSSPWYVIVCYANVIDSERGSNRMYKGFEKGGAVTHVGSPSRTDSVFPDPVAVPHNPRSCSKNQIGDDEGQ